MTEAVLYTEHFCGMCGEGKYVYMQKTWREMDCNKSDSDVDILNPFWAAQASEDFEYLDDCGRVGYQMRCTP
jgi:hypothetical protein